MRTFTSNQNLLRICCMWQSPFQTGFLTGGLKKIKCFQSIFLFKIKLKVTSTWNFLSFKTLSLMLPLFITHLTPTPLLEGENLFRPPLVWASGHLQQFLGADISSTAMCLIVLQLHFAPGWPDGFKGRNTDVLENTRLWSHPNLRQLSLPPKNLSAYYKHYFNFASAAQ